MNGALEKLSKTQYHTLMLWSSGYSFNEIAQLTATNLGTVKSRLHYARKKMQSLLADYCV
jgi:DNA-directed RNA polymerase specialized sigma24 family protein